MNEIEGAMLARCLPFVIESVPNGVIIVDQSGHIRMANRQAEDIFGYRREELLGRRLSLLIARQLNRKLPDGDFPFFESSIIEPMRVGRDLYGRRKDGSEVPVEIGLKPLRTPQGTFVLSQIVDITSRKQQEARLLRIKEIEAQESERGQLARALHNELAQLLSAISLNLQEVKQMCGPCSEQLEEVIRRNNRAIEQVQNFSFDLQPSMLDDLGLVATLKWYAKRKLQHLNLVLHFVAHSSGARLATEPGMTCYRVLQESLTNIIRHSNAQQVWIEFQDTSEEIRLSIRDDGVGFDLTALHSEASGKADRGMLRMRERVEILGGRIEFQSAPTEGTVIDVRIPLASASSTQS